MTVERTDDELLTMLARAFGDAGPAPSRLVAAAQALPLGADVVDLATRRAKRLERTLAAAAASDRRVLEHEYRSADGSILTRVQENEEAHLLLTVSTEGEGPFYVEVSWTPVDADGVGDRQTLRTPLARTRSGWSVHYDLGPVARHEAIDIEPAEEIDYISLEHADVELAFSLGLTGGARRAWELALEHLRAIDDPLAAAVAECLAR